MTIVHVLHGGLAFCRFSDRPPADWPPGTRWVALAQLGELTFTCPACNRVSHNSNDVVHSYCGACHRFFPEAPHDHQVCATCVERALAIGA